MKRSSPIRKTTATKVKKSSYRKTTSNLSLNDPRVQRKLQELIEEEVHNILLSENILIPVTDQKFQIKDYTIEVGSAEVLCKKKEQLLRSFHTKQCAILYIVNLLENRDHIAWKIEILDDEIYHLRNKEELLNLQAQNIAKKDRDRAEVIHHKLSEIKARLSKTLGTVKKYSFLAKYQKGITV